MKTIRYWGSCKKERERIRLLEGAARDLLDAIRSSSDAVSNDLGNAMVEMEQVLKR
jgi:hypothetical protein